ncbi:nuclear transport factor 2 family protein [Alkalihalobacillus sp. CinArs1]|uniref:nuclear transport factor 2 family protein n=1 Tax=Alkalihalobacillus sp. CinArs1 TaxID=2995314 RepID=UPI0022DDDA27|nr:nuclear transport factor 2 family protein [Alkalihalobacillus sp. CinArs1]
MKTEKKIEVLITELENKLLLPQIRKSKKALDKLIADEFEEFGSSGVRLSKADILKGLVEEQPSELIMTHSNVVKLSDDVILITYTLTRKESESRSLRSSIWKQSRGAWQLFFHQGTKAKGISET